MGKGLWNQGEGRSPSPPHPQLVPSTCEWRGSVLGESSQSNFWAPPPGPSSPPPLQTQLGRRPCFCKRVPGRVPLVPTPVLLEKLTLTPIRAAALTARPDTGRAGSHLPAQGPGKGGRTANQDSFHLGLSAPTPELLQSPLTEYLLSLPFRQFPTFLPECCF